MSRSLVIYTMSFQDFLNNFEQLTQYDQRYQWIRITPHHSFSAGAVFKPHTIHISTQLICNTRITEAILKSAVHVREWMTSVTKYKVLSQQQTNDRLRLHSWILCFHLAWHAWQAIERIGERINNSCFYLKYTCFWKVNTKLNWLEYS